MKNWIISVALGTGIFLLLGLWVWAGLHVSPVIFAAPVFIAFIGLVAWAIYEHLTD